MASSMLLRADWSVNNEGHYASFPRHPMAIGIHRSPPLNGGDVAVAWDSFDGESFNVVLRRLQSQTWQPTRSIAATSRFEGRAQVVFDASERLWIAWEEGGENWGRAYRGINTESIRDRHGPLHRYRELRLAHIDAGDEMHEPTTPLPMPSLHAAVDRADKPDGLEKTGAFYERARLAVDQIGRPWIAYRHYYTPWLGITHQSHIEQGWGLYARCLTDRGWSPLYQMEIGQGDGMQRLELSGTDRGIVLGWTTGRTHRTTNARPRGIVTAPIEQREGSSPTTDQLAQATDLPLVAASEVADMDTHDVTLGGTRFSPLFGDLHRHTDLSLCRVPIDGTIDDAYRYAIEVAQLDFLGITDHTRDIAQGNVLSHLWWRCRKEVYRHQLQRDDGTMHFIPLYAYERSHGNTADHNVISLRPDMLRPFTYPIPVFWLELDHDTLTIPHQPIRRDTWHYQNDALRPLVEIFQGCRDESIEDHVHQGLGLGYHLGFIASSDHMSTSASYACVWADAARREPLFRSLQARRTYAATDKIVLRVNAGDRWMGEIIPTVGTATPIDLHATGTAPIRTINWIVDGKVWKTDTPLVRTITQRESIPPGHKYVYVHILQVDGNEAWSSPLWFDEAAAEAP